MSKTRRKAAVKKISRYLLVYIAGYLLAEFLTDRRDSVSAHLILGLVFLAAWITTLDGIRLLIKKRKK